MFAGPEKSGRFSLTEKLFAAIFLTGIIDKGEMKRMMNGRSIFPEGRRCRALEIGDVVYLNGRFTRPCQIPHESRREKHSPPLDFTKLNVLIHAGPFVKKVYDKWIRSALILPPVSTWINTGLHC